VHLGFFISDDASEIYKTLGISGASHTRAESEAIWKAVIAQVNARGGLGGRRIVPSFAWITSDSGTNATRSQAACEQLTHDEHVFAVVVDGATDISAASCFAQRHVPVIDVGQTSYPYDDVDLRSLAPYLYVPGRLSMGRFATYVDQLAAHGFFSKGSKVGLLRFDLPDQLRTRRDVIEPALKRHGLTLTTDVAFSPVEGTADLPRAANESQAAVLQMRAAGVDRVLFLGSGLSLPYVFPTVADSQGYRPVYGITTDDGPDFMATNAPAAQMTNAMAVGWEPQYDVPDSDAVLKSDPLWQSCARLMRATGFTPRDGRRCTAVYFLEQALRGATALTPQALRAGADRLGATPYSTQNYATRFGPGRYDGVSTVRVLRFHADCTCFRYLTGDVPVR
jgi:ABC-type branched-subunit amino acid transport system substrate-binding protein